MQEDGSITFFGIEVDQFPLDLHRRWLDLALSRWRSPVEIAKIQERISVI